MGETLFEDLAVWSVMMQNDPTRILLIEDDSKDLDLIQNLLAVKQFPVKIEPLERLSCSLDRLRQGAIDIVLLDLYLPDGDGLNTFRQIHAQCPEVPIIVLSGMRDEEVALAAVQEGAQDYLVKGQFDSRLLIRAIRYAIERQRLLLTMVQQTQALQASERQLRTIITQNADGILIVDRHAVIRFVNPAAESLFGWKPEDLQGEVFSFPLVAGKITQLDVQRPSGEMAAAEMRLVEVKWQGETAYLASVRDVTERKQTEDSVRRALAKERELSELKSRIISTISHEYRTPLTTIASSAQLLERYRHQFEDSQQRKHFQRIQTAVNHMNVLVDDVLFVSQAEFEKLEFKPAPLNVVTFLQEVANELRSTLSQQHRLIFTSIGECGERNFDAKLLRQILTNLLSNAIKYSPQGDTIALQLTCDEHQVSFQIQDKGIGIPAADQQKLFESFSRASNVGTIAGTGLGLSIVKKCVDLHRGKIAVKSEVGVGTTFTVSLPVPSEYPHKTA